MESVQSGTAVGDDICILTNFGIVEAGHGIFVEKEVQDAANQHFKGGGGTDASGVDTVG